MNSFEEFYDAYKKQMEYCIGLLVNADNAIDIAHRERCPLPYLSCMIDDCIRKGKSVQEGGAIYNFTGPQGFGIANMADSLYAIKNSLWWKKVTLKEYKEALENNYGEELSVNKIEELIKEVIRELISKGEAIDKEIVINIAKSISEQGIGLNQRKDIRICLNL